MNIFSIRYACLHFVDKISQLLAYEEIRGKKLIDVPIHVSFDPNIIVAYREKNPLDENSTICQYKRIKLENNFLNFK